LWSQIDLSLNNTLVSHSNNSHPYRAYLETLLSYGPAAKNSQLSANLWLEDKTDHFDSLGADKEGYTKRKALTAKRSEVDMMGKLHLDMCFQQRHFINGVDVKLRLVRAMDMFCLLSDQQYKVKLKDVAFFCRKVTKRRCAARPD